MRKRFLTAAVVLAALVVPSSALANPFAGAVAAGSNPTTRDAIGFCVAAGQANYNIAGFSTGDNRSSFAGEPGAVADLIAGARANCSGGLQSWYASLPGPFPVTP
jgi:hypothetical protein